MTDQTPMAVRCSSRRLLASWRGVLLVLAVSTVVGWIGLRSYRLYRWELSVARAPRGTLTGREYDFWSDYSVVVATVARVLAPPQGTCDTYRATLVPKATLSGSFDSSLYGTVPVRFYGYVTDMIRPPRQGATVLAVIRVDSTVPVDEQLSVWIEPITFEFMPDGLPLVVIDGLDDRRVDQTLKRIRAARANPEPPPWERPADESPPELAMPPD